MDPTVDLDSLVQRLMAEDALKVGKCSLVRNVNCDCVTGTDPLGIDAVAAFSACMKGCRDAVVWAVRANQFGPRQLI
jgi:hypothetical protein